MGWPQVTMLAWLAFAICASTYSAVRHLRRPIFLHPRQQRLASIGFAAAAFGEALTLYAGGFFS